VILMCNDHGLRKVPKPKGQTVGCFQKGLITLLKAIAAEYTLDSWPW